MTPGGQAPDEPPPGAPCPPDFNAAAHVLGAAREIPQEIALEVVGGDPVIWRFGDLERAVLGLGGAFLARGLEPGSRVMIRLGNRVEYPLVHLGAIAAGLVPVPTSAQWTQREVDVAAGIVAPDLVVAQEGLAVPRGVPVMSPEAVREGCGHAPAEWALGDADRLAYVVFTSGTSGLPRAVGHAHRAVWARRSMLEGWTGLGRGDALLHAGAFNWTYTMGTGLLDPWSVGARALIPAEGTRIEALPGLLEAHGATIFAAAPGIYRRMLRHGMKPLPCLRHGLSAGEKLPEALRSAWEEATGTPIFEAYGLSECSTFVSGAPGAPAPPGRLGRPQPGRRVAVLGTQGPVQPGAIGELAVSADDPGLMLGYLGQEEATRQRVRDGWFLTGDMASMDARGWITFHGRADDMMNAGGHRVSPVEVEEVVAAFDGISEAAAAEVEIRPGVGVIAAFYVAAGPVDEAALAAHCRERLAQYKTPRLLRRVEQLPRGANEKLLRRRLREDRVIAAPAEAYGITR